MATGNRYVGFTLGSNDQHSTPLGLAMDSVPTTFCLCYERCLSASAT